MPLLSSHRLPIEDAPDHLQTYLVEVGEWCVSPVVLVLFVVVTLALVFGTCKGCCGCCKRDTSSSRKLPVAGWLALVAGGVTIAVVLLLASVRAVIDDANGTIDTVLSSMDRGTSNALTMRSNAVQLSPTILSYLDTVEQGAFQDMQGVWNEERAMRHISLVNQSIVEGEMAAMRQVLRQVRSTLTTNNTQALKQFDDGLQKWKDGRQKLSDNRHADQVAQVRTYALWGALGLLGLVLVVVAMMLPWLVPDFLKRFVVLPLTLLMLLAVVFMVLAVPWDDACDYSHTLEAERLSPHSNLTEYRVAWACLHNKSLLAAAGVNLTLVLNVTQLVTFPTFPTPFVIDSADSLDQLRVVKMQTALDACTVDLRPRFLDPLFRNLTDLAALAVCDTIGTQITATRDDVCSVWLKLYMLVLFTAVFGLGVAALLVWYSSERCASGVDRLVHCVHRGRKPFATGDPMYHLVSTTPTRPLVSSQP